MGWSSYQEAVFANVQSGEGNAVVEAVAGAGKTTTIVEALKRVPEGRTVLMMAFNKEIQVELARRAPTYVDVKTCHSHGFAAVRRKFRNVRVDDTRSLQICERLFGDRRENRDKGLDFGAVSNLVRVAKDVLLPFGAVNAFDACADEFGVDVPEDSRKRDAFIAAAVRVHAESRKVEGVIDFADMCWLPVVLNLPVWSYDVVFVDETQDLCPSQIELLLKSVRRGGRVIAVGDPMQAIYAFRGADTSTMKRLTERLEARVLPLSVTYRCPKAVVSLAQKVVPHLQHSDTAREGNVREGDVSDMMSSAKAGDMIVSRTNAPLLAACLRLLAGGTRASIKGRNIGEGLIRLVEKSNAKTVADLGAWLKVWSEKECRRLAKKEKSADEVLDKVECIMALAEGLDGDATDGVKMLVARASKLFSDDDGAGKVTLGTTHKLKGLEAGRVWMLAETFRAEKGGEEANIWYVAVTRAKEELVMVTGLGRGE